MGKDCEWVESISSQQMIETGDIGISMIQEGELEVEGVGIMTVMSDGRREKRGKK